MNRSTVLAGQQQIMPQPYQNNPIQVYASQAINPLSNTQSSFNKTQILPRIELRSRAGGIGALASGGGTGHGGLYGTG